MVEADNRLNFDPLSGSGVKKWGVGGFSFSDRDWRLLLRDWATQLSSDSGVAEKPKSCDQVLTIGAEEAELASHPWTGEAGTSRLSDAMSVGAKAMDESVDASACE